MEIPPNTHPISYLRRVFYTTQFDWSDYWVVDGQKHVCGWPCWFLVVGMRLAALAIFCGLLAGGAYLASDPSPAVQPAIERPATPAKLPATRYANLP